MLYCTFVYSTILDPYHTYIRTYTVNYSHKLCRVTSCYPGLQKDTLAPKVTHVFPDAFSRLTFLSTWQAGMQCEKNNMLQYISYMIIYDRVCKNTKYIQ